MLKTKAAMLNLDEGDLWSSGVAICPTLRCNKKCRNCLHSTVYQKEDFSPTDYIPWLLRLNELVSYKVIRLTGGEPFLHNNLYDFIKELRKALKDKQLLVFTNGFWLPSVDKFTKVVGLVDFMRFSLYPGESDNNIDLLKNLFPNKLIEAIQITHFKESSFSEAPETVTMRCEHERCLQLLPNGHLARCGQVYGIGVNPNMTPQFLDHSSDLFFDLRRSAGLYAWYHNWPLEACSYCSVWKNNMVPHSSLEYGQESQEKNR